MTYTCTKCGDSYRDNETAPLGHNYVMETVSATCTEKGGTVYTCTRCGKSYKGSETEALGHAYVSRRLHRHVKKVAIHCIPVRDAEVLIQIV